MLRINWKLSGLPIVLVVGVCLNIGGAIIAKFLALNLESFLLASLLSVALGLVYVGRFKFWISVSRLYQLSYIYPMLSVSYLVSLFVGRLVFDEEYSITKLIGSFIIVAGVVVVSTSKHKMDIK